ncbi:MAG: DUF3225 domain-containing protein [Calditrichaeota bacterium]|nr:MAG: DUF3225 domain-containing protein [Calditrichota bacterium]
MAVRRRRVVANRANEKRVRPERRAHNAGCETGKSWTPIRMEEKQMGLLWMVVVILIISVSAGLVFNTWLMNKREQKKRDELLKKAVAKYEENFRATFGEKNLEALKGFLTDKVTLFSHGKPYLIEGSKDVIRWFELGMVELETLTVHNQSVRVLFDSVAVVTSTFTLRGKKEDKPYETTGKTSRVWMRDEDQWKLVHEHTSFN